MFYRSVERWWYTCLTALLADTQLRKFNTLRVNTLPWLPPLTHSQPPDPFLGPAPAVVIDSALTGAAVHRVEH